MAASRGGGAATRRSGRAAEGGDGEGRLAGAARGGGCGAGAGREAGDEPVPVLGCRESVDFDVEWGVEGRFIWDGGWGWGWGMGRRREKGEVVHVDLI